MTTFAGAKAGTQQIYAAGNIKRKVNGKEVDAALAVEFNSSPDFRTLTATQHRFVPGSALVDTYTDALLLNEKGDSAKVQPMTIEPVAKDAKATLTGPAFAWTKAQIVSNTIEGAVVDTVFDFGKDKITFKLNKKGKTVEDTFEEVGELAVVEKSQFYDFIRTSKTAAEKLALQV
eukprot:UN01327